MFFDYACFTNVHTGETNEINLSTNLSWLPPIMLKIGVIRKSNLEIQCAQRSDKLMKYRNLKNNLKSTVLTVANLVMTACIL
mgnify:CR=1 FL=1